MSRYFVHLTVFAGLITLASECNNDCPDPCDTESTSRISKDSIHISWNAGSDIPVGLRCTAASVLDNQIYVSGGISTVTGASNLLHF